MPTDTSARGIELLIRTILAGHSCEPSPADPADGTECADGDTGRSTGHWSGYDGDCRCLAVRQLAALRQTAQTEGRDRITCSLRRRTVRRGILAAHRATDAPAGRSLHLRHPEVRQAFSAQQVTINWAGLISSAVAVGDRLMLTYSGAPGTTQVPDKAQSTVRFGADFGPGSAVTAETTVDVAGPR